MKRLKMLLYGEPGVGKSVFASKAPKPFFITTDGNYEWLEEFGAKPEAHKQVFSWAEAKDAFAQSYDEYETIVVDLLEDMFKWCEHDYCVRAKLEHVSDVGFGKGYDITRNEFFLEIAKLLAKDKHIILITHGITFVTKDRRGVEHTRHAPSNRIPDKVLDMIEGRLRYCLRCYLKAEEQQDGSVQKKRFLSVVPKENEFGIARGLEEDKVPHDIELDFDEFANIIGLYKNAQTEEKKVEKKLEAKSTQTIETTSGQIELDINKFTSISPSIAMPIPETVIEKHAEPIEVKVVEPVKQDAIATSNADKLAAIKAKLAAVKAANK